MPRLPTLLIAAVLAVAFGSAQLAQSQTEPPGQTEVAPKGKKKALTPEEKAQRKAERAAKRATMTPEEKAKAKEERASKKAAAQAKKAKRQECVAQGKQDGLKGPKLREFMKTCTAG